MNRNAVVISLVVIFSILGGAFFLLNGSDSKNSPQPTSGTQSGVENGAQEPATSSAGKYVDFNENVIAGTSGTKLLFFHAPWCPQCRALDADIKAKGVPEGVTIIKVDYDTNQGLRQKYGVTLQTTFVSVDDAGNLVEKYIAYDSPTLQAVKDNLLQP